MYKNKRKDILLVSPSGLTHRNNFPEARGKHLPSRSR